MLVPNNFNNITTVYNPRGTLILFIFFFRIQSKPFFIVIGLSILVVLVSLLAFISKRDVENEMPDPQFELAPSSMPMGLYNKAGVVSNGGPCAQIGV